MKELSLLMSNLSEGNREALKEIIIELAGASSDKFTGRITFDCDYSQGTIAKIGYIENRTLFSSAKKRKIRSSGVK